MKRKEKLLIRDPFSNTILADSLLSLFQKSRTLFHWKQILTLASTSGFLQDAFFLEKILHSLTSSRINSLSHALPLCNFIKPTNISLWNRIIRSISTSSQPQNSILFYARMRTNGVTPDKHTFPLLLKAFSRARNQNPSQIFTQVLKMGLEFDRFVRNALVSAFANSAYLDSAREMFDQSSQKDLIAWTALIDGYVKNGFAIEGLRCFMEMRSSGVRADEVAVVSVLCAAGIQGDIYFGRWVHGFYVEAGRVKCDVYIGSALIDMYSRCGNPVDARRVFDELPCRNVVSWSALVAGYVQCNRFKDALAVFQEMLLANVVPNQFTLTSVLTACAQIGAIDQGRWVHGHMDRNRVYLNSIVGTSLIDMYAKCGCLDEAMLVFEKLPVKDVYPWTAIINGLAVHGDALNALKLFSMMLRSKVQPNEITFLGVFCACSHGGLVDEGKRLFKMMRESYQLEPNADHYGCMVDLLGRTGHIDEAWNMVLGMPMQPSAGVLGALFGACMIHKAFELGEHIGKYLIWLQPKHSGRYTLLSNLYSTCQKWEAAANVRMLMKQRGVGKASGYSWIEINGVIQEFIAFEQSHHEIHHVYAMLDNLTFHLKLVGSIADIE